MLVLVVAGLRVIDGNLSIRRKENVVYSKKSATGLQVLGGVACSG